MLRILTRTLTDWLNPRRNRTSREAHTPVEREIQEGAARLSEWASAAAGKRIDARLHDVSALETVLHEAAPEVTRREQFLSDLASFLGEAARSEYGGAWTEDDLLGLVLKGPSDLRHVVLNPLAMAQKKVELSSELSLAQFFLLLPGRMAAERRVPPELTEEGTSAGQLLQQMSEAEGTEQQVARAQSDQLTAYWRSRFGQTLPLSLQGAREMDRFLRTQFFLFSVPRSRLHQMGFFLGEVGRGLFEGTWDFSEAVESREPARAALAWPELSYTPIGKVFKFLIDQPEGGSLDEYIRLIPSARREMRDV